MKSVSVFIFSLAFLVLALAYALRPHITDVKLDLLPMRPAPQPAATPVDLPIAVPTAAAVPVRLVVSSADIDESIMAVGVPADRVLVSPSVGVGWLDVSAVPGGGDNVVLFGHNYLLLGLEHVTGGDVFSVQTADGAWHDYTVANTKIVAEEGQPLEVRQANAATVPTGREQISFITCWPFPSGVSHRLIVTAYPKEY